MLKVEELRKRFPYQRSFFGRPTQWVQAVDRVSLRVETGQTLALVGESGSGKTTIGRSILRLIQADSGEISWKDIKIHSANRSEMRRLRRKMQIVFQDPFSSLNPRFTIKMILSEPFRIQGNELTKRELNERIVSILESVGLEGEHLGRYPHEFSGGQRQRIGIARAIALNPEFLILDEPVSALDLSVQAQILNLLIELKEKNAFTYLFIAHDLSVVRYISDHIAVLYLGKIVEYASNASLFDNPAHPYTQGLLASVPRRAPWLPRSKTLSGEIPSPINPPSGCPFRPRCPKAANICKKEIPPTKKRQEGGWYVCHF